MSYKIGKNSIWKYLNKLPVNKVKMILTFGVLAYLFNKIKMIIIEWITHFLSDYVNGQINYIIDTVTDIRSPAYTWLFLLIYVTIYREITFNKK
jgi:hypothetical protein